MWGCVPKNFEKICYSDRLLDGRHVTSMLTDYIALPGFYRASLIIAHQVPTRVYKCRLVAQDTTSGSTLFKDSIYAVLSQRDASISILGWTGINGAFETQDSLFFPNVVSLPPLVRTDLNGNRLGTFSITDSVTITLSDTSAHRGQQFASVVKKGVNDFQLIWNPTTDSAISSGETRRVASVHQVKRFAKTTLEWKLEQNFPNPFN